MNKTILGLLNDILVFLNFETVNDINESEVSEQVYSTMKDIFYHLISQDDWEHTRETFSLIGANDTNKPVLMQVPEEITNLEELFYKNTSGDYIEIEFVKSSDFVKRLNGVSGSNYAEYSGMVKKLNTPLKIMNNVDPTFCTSFDDVNIIFNSFNNTVETTLQETKCLAHGVAYPIFPITNDEEIDLPADLLWSYFMPEAKSTCSLVVNKFVDEKQESLSTRGRNKMYSAKGKLGGKQPPRIQNYGRR
jgi:hypothetical protein